MRPSTLITSTGAMPIARDNSIFLLSILVAFASLFALSASAQDGSVDATFNSTDLGYNYGDGPNNQIFAVAQQNNGQAIVAGAFTYYNGLACSRVARLNADGTLDPSFTTPYGALAGDVLCVAIQTDGKIILGGMFLSYNGNGVMGLVRLNYDGSLDPSFNMGTGPNSWVQTIKLQPNGKILIGGSFNSYNGTPRKRLARLNTNGTLDMSFDPGVGPGNNVCALEVQNDGSILAAGPFTTWNGAQYTSLVRISSTGVLDATYNTAGGTFGDATCLALQDDGRLVVGGSFSAWGGTARKNIVRLTTAGVVDMSFNPGQGTNDVIRSVIKLTSGQFLLGGDFTTYNLVSRVRIARINGDGTLDAGFNPGTGTTGRVGSLVERTDGKVILVGTFTSYNNIGRVNVARVNTDGSLDNSFATNSGANGTVSDIEVQPDGKILIAGFFTLYNGVSRNRIARLNADGTLDQNFNPGTGANAGVYSIVVQSDGKVLIAGEFTTINDVARSRVARLNANGSLDASFDPGAGPNNEAYCVALQADGKVLLGGRFTSYNGTARGRLARLTSTGILDGTFFSGAGMDDYVYTMDTLGDGHLLVGGAFTTCNGAMRTRIARLHSDGSTDLTFNTGLDAGVRSMVHLANGKVLIGGLFTLVNGTTRMYCARLNADGTLDNGFDAGNVNAIVTAIEPLSNGRIAFAGTFSLFGGITCGQLMKTDANGAPDGGGLFPQANNPVYALARQTDGKLLVGGQFDHLGNTGRNRIGRLNLYGGVSVKVMLQGPYNGTLMNDALRTLPSFPLTAPFTAMGYSESGYVAGATTTSGVLAATGNNAIVDWVLVEMRATATPGTVATSRAALLQRDGDVVGMDGVSPLTFKNLASGNYRVAVKPRNHLPVMQAAAAPLAYGAAASSINFTLSGTQVHDADARIASGAVMLLAAGDVTFNEEVKYTGAGNDRDPILTRVGGTTPNNTVNGYYAEDLNMDGVVKYTGSGNDRDPILTTIGGTVPTSTRNAQLP